MLEQPILPTLPDSQKKGGSQTGEAAHYFTNNPPGYKWKVLSTVIFGVFMVILDTTVVNVAFQTIRTDFGGSLADAQWVISIYVLALGITTPLAGFLANRYGAKKIYLGGLSLFALGSLICGLSPNLNLLIVARAIQGAGGGVALPLGTALLLQAFPSREQGTALGIFGIAALVAPAVGPIVGGWLVDQGLWRVIFFLNPPIGLIGVLLGLRFLRGHEDGLKPRFDPGGVITSVIGFSAILYATSVAATLGWTSPITLACFAVGVVGLAAFGLVELFWAKEPLLDLRLFGNRTFLNASLLGYVSTVALFGAEFLMPIYLQALRGRTALQTGMILLPMAITGGIFVTLSGRIYDKIGPRPLMVAGFLLLVVNTWQLSQIRADTTIAWILFLLVLRGMALGMTVQTTMVTALSVVSRQDLARGSSLTNATRLVIQSIGVAVLATVLTSTLSAPVVALQQQDPPAPVAGQTASSSHPLGLCEVPAVNPSGSQPQVLLASLVVPALKSDSIINLACQENVAGFERAYTVTFYAAILAVFLGLFLPGWPSRWVGRR
jgi:EmrB/QacA subfamily drug resistance transporter